MRGFLFIFMSEAISYLHALGKMPLSRYVRECLYNPKFGYYAKKGVQRVGAAGDFYTSSSVNPEVFGALLLESARAIAREKFGGDSGFEICEIGAEPDAELFAGSAVFRFCDSLELSGKLFLFSNELIDAQPFDRFVFEGGKIYKTFVKFTERGEAETSLEDCEACEREFLFENFPPASSRFTLDFSFDALDLLRKICAQNWRGVLIFADYFRLLGEILEFPNGTARIYKKHRASSDIFFAPSECDITFSPTSEVFVELLRREGLIDAQCSAQGAFFMKNAAFCLRKIVESEGALSPRKRALAELLSPSGMGEMFRILSAVKP